MPRLTTRAFSEMIHLPGYEQQRILLEQKYPREGSSVFKIPYYIPALSKIKEYYANGNDVEIINEWVRDEALGLTPQHKSHNNIRVVMAFISSSNSKRILVPKMRLLSYIASPHQNVELKLKFDLDVEENGLRKYILINCRNISIEKRVAEDTIQIAYWVMLQNEIDLDISQIEYWDLTNGKIFISNKLLKRTITNMKNNANFVDAIWSTI